MADALLHAAGYVRAGLYLLSFALLQAGTIRGTSYTYILMNVAAASLVLTRRFLQNRRLRFSPEDEDLRQRAFPLAPAAIVRGFLGAGTWVKLSQGQTLTEKGRPVETLYFIQSGEAEALLDGRFVGWMEHGFVFEIHVLRGGTASATVRAAAPLQVFAISGEALRRLCRRDAEMKTHIEAALSQDTGRKLQAGNAQATAHNAAACALPGSLAKRGSLAP